MLALCCRDGTREAASIKWRKEKKSRVSSLTKTVKEEAGGWSEREDKHKKSWQICQKTTTTTSPKAPLSLFFLLFGFFFVLFTLGWGWKLGEVIGIMDLASEKKRKCACFLPLDFPRRQATIFINLLGKLTTEWGWNGNKNPISTQYPEYIKFLCPTLIKVANRPKVCRKSFSFIDLCQKMKQKEILLIEISWSFLVIFIID